MKKPARIAEFRGPNQLAEATHEVLTNRNLDVAVVRGIGLPLGEKWDWLGDKDTPIAYQKFAKIMPAIVGASSIIEDWWNKNCAPLGWQHMPHPTARGRTERSKPHFDPLHNAGVTYSFRYDDRPDIERYFYARRVTEPTLLAGGKGHDKQMNAVRQRLTHISFNPTHWGIKMSRVVQNPDDVVVFPNHPFPAMHATSTSEEGHTQSTATRAVLACHTTMPIAQAPIVPAGNYSQPVFAQRN